jgi:protein-S-isoprenylcysteine O-methyltransferase Ste14
MSTLVIVLRAVALLAFAGPASMLRRRRAAPEMRRPDNAAQRLPVVANFVAAGAFFPTLLYFASGPEVAAALPLALGGCLLAIVGVGLVAASRHALGAAWSLVPKASAETGLVTAGPYRIVRHPIYLGLIVMAIGQTVAFGSWAAAAVVVLGLVPTFAWRAVAEERLLCETFGERYADYRARTKLIVPFLL